MPKTKIVLTLISMLLGPLIDTFGRKHDYLRISLTDACNLRCVYCMPNEKMMVTPSAKMMSADEIAYIAGAFVERGVKKIRLTGGEPLLRKDFAAIIKRLAKLQVELTISTNAVLIDQYIDVIKEAGVASVNVSLDALKPDTFLAITKRSDFDKIINNIQLLLSKDFRVKLNVVVMKDINEHVILDFVEWTKDFALEVRFIEFMPFHGNEWQRNKVYSYKEMLNTISSHYEITKLQDGLHDTTKKYRVVGYTGNFAFISTISAPFCDGCNRLRLTADGKMKNCLFDKNEMDLLGLLRRGEDIQEAIDNSVNSKKKERGGLFNNLDNTEALDKNRAMIRIGG